MRRFLLVLLAVLVAASLGALAFALWRPGRPDRPNLIVLTLDTTRADHVGSYGYFRDTTPHLDLLATKAQRFESAWAPMATTLPSHMSLMTGAWPLEHGVLSNVEHGGRRTMPSDRLEPIATLLAREGYTTAAVVSATPLRRGTGIERGFRIFDQPPGNVRRAKPTTDAALDTLRRHLTEPFFLWVHYFDPHGPFDPPEPYRKFVADDTLGGWLDARGIEETSSRVGGAGFETREAHDGYDGEIRYVDDQINRLLNLLEKRGLGDRTIVVVVADHGEGLGQHGVGGHGYVWREQVQVPLFVVVPWLRPQSIDQPIGLADLMPRVVEWLGAQGGDAWSAAIRETDPGVGLLALSSLRQGTFGSGEQVALTVEPWRWVRVDEAASLFHLPSDPYEQRDLAAALPLHREFLAARASRAVSAQQRRGAELGTGASTLVPADELRALEALGYLEE